MMATAEAQALLEEAFDYPEHASFFCPVRTRARLLGLLADGSPLVYRRDGLLMWLASGGHFVLYLARNAEVLAAHAQDGMETLITLARREGAIIGSIYATSNEARKTFLRTGFRDDDALQRLRHGNAQASPLDPRVRALERHDVEQLAAVGQRAFPDQGWTPELWASPIEGADRAWVALADGRPAGFLLASDMERFSLITGLAVDPALQGAGLGKALIRAELAAAAQLGLSAVEVHANDRPQALATYEHCGFKVLHPAWALTRWW